MFVHESIKVRSYYSHPSVELLSITVESPIGLLLLAVMYRPPGTDSDYSQLDDALQLLNLSKVTHAVLVGDFNVDLCEPQTVNALDLLSVFAGYGLQQCVKEPTRVSGCKSSLLDLVLSTEESLIQHVSVTSPLGSSDHNSVTTTLSFTRPNLRRCQRQIWLYQKADFCALNDALDQALFPVESVSTLSVNQAWLKFRRVFMGTVCATP